jgi:hypothetical protein
MVSTLRLLSLRRECWLATARRPIRRRHGNCPCREYQQIGPTFESLSARTLRWLTVVFENWITDKILSLKAVF